MAENKNLIKGNTGDWEVVIGMEVHAQTTSEAKLFSGSSTEFGALPNAEVSFVDAAMPGMLPVINKKCVELAVKTGLGLKAEINLHSVFDRKNYFYPDLPQGYQISQFKQPIVGKGELELDLPDGTTRTIGITRLHLEQDAGKSLHDQNPSESFIDLNRSGVALMEIVSEPDMRSAEEAAAYLKKLRIILRYLGTCDGNMDEGSMRADVNVSVRKPGDGLGTRCEIKNVNSMRFVAAAVEYESRRQIKILEEGGKIDQETRLFDNAKGETRSMRSKEEAHDYRYFPDPDLLPLVLDAVWVNEIKKSLPKLPDEIKKDLQENYGLSAYNASVLVSEKEMAEFFQRALDETLRATGIPAQKIAVNVANLILGDYIAAVNRLGKMVGTLWGDQDAVMLAGLLKLQFKDETISGRIAKDVFIDMVETGKSAADIVQSKGLQQVSDTGAIEKAIDEVMAANADKVAEYRSGKDKLFGFFVGQTMKATGGKANPAVLNELLKKKLQG